MEPHLLRSLRARRLQIRARWEAFLRVERVTTPLGHPDTLVHLLDRTLDQIFTLLEAPVPPAPPSSRMPACACGRHPLLAYFRAGEQALLEALIFAQASLSLPDRSEREAAVAEVRQALRHLATEEFEAFAGLCRHNAQGRAPAPAA